MKQLGALHDLATFLTAQMPLGKRVDDLANYAAQATQAAACSIMLLVEDDAAAQRLKIFAATKTLPESAWSEVSVPGNGMAGKVIAQGKPLLIADIRDSPLAPEARKRDELGWSYIGIPIVVNDTIIGVMNLANHAGAHSFDQADLRLAGIVAALTGQAIQVERLQTLLRSRIAQLTLAREKKNVIGSLTDGTLPPSRLAKLLARSFYKDLADAGFEPGQIVEAASEIIAQITTDITRFGKRMARKGT